MRQECGRFPIFRKMSEAELVELIPLIETVDTNGAQVGIVCKFRYLYFVSVNKRRPTFLFTSCITFSLN